MMLIRQKPGSKAVERLLHGQCYGYCFLNCVSNMFPFGFMEALDSKGILNALKKVLSQSWNCLTFWVPLLLHDE